MTLSEKKMYFESLIFVFHFPGSPLSCVAVDVAGAAITGLKTTLPANKLTAFTIETPSAGVSEFSAVVDITSENMFIVQIRKSIHA